MRSSSDALGDVRLRPGRPGDAEALARIYDHAVRTSLATFDLVEQGPEHLADSIGHQDPTQPLIVATVRGAAVGYAHASVYRPRPAYDGTRETSIYLDPAWVGRGIGTMTYAALLDTLDTAGCHTALALVALPNPASEALHRSLGFGQVGTMREVGRKFQRWVDTAWYQRLHPR